MTDTLTTHTAHPSFRASERLAAHLQQLLVDLTDLHLVGKEITRFHCVYWPAFLMAAGLDPAGVVVVPYGHAADLDGYAAGLAGYADGGLEGVKGWILQCCAAVTRGADQLAMISSGGGP